MATKIKNGDKVRDTISGFEGIVTGITSWLNGCDTAGVKPQKLHEGKPIENQWFDIMRLQKIEEKTTEETPPGEGVG